MPRGWVRDWMRDWVRDWVGPSNGSVPWPRWIIAAGLVAALFTASPALAAEPGRPAGTAHPALIFSDGARRQLPNPASQILADQPDPGTIPIDPRTLALVVDLDSPDYQRRETVTRELLSGDVSVMQLSAVLSQAALNAEQRYRLIEVLQELLLNTPRGALGISMQRNPLANIPQNEVVVMALLDGLPAREVLRVGDRIQGINGQPLRRPEELTETVQSFKPGTRLKLSVLRPRTNEHGEQIRENDRPVYDPIEVDIVLGSAELLDQSPLASSSDRAQRRYMAHEKAMQFAPPSRQILAPQPPPSGGALLPENAVTWTDAVDANKYVQQILHERQEVRSGRQVVNAALLRRWQSTRELLEAAAQEPGLSREDAIYRHLVAQRYAELIPID